MVAHMRIRVSKNQTWKKKTSAPHDILMPHAIQFHFICFSRPLSFILYHSHSITEINRHFHLDCNWCNWRMFQWFWPKQRNIWKLLHRFVSLWVRNAEFHATFLISGQSVSISSACTCTCTRMQHIAQCQFLPFSWVTHISQAASALEKVHLLLQSVKLTSFLSTDIVLRAHIVNRRRQMPYEMRCNENIKWTKVFTLHRNKTTPTAERQ